MSELHGRLRVGRGRVCHVTTTSTLPLLLLPSLPSLPLSFVRMAYYNTNSHSPPPLQHPVPTHPAYIPEPPSTPMSPQGYQRYSSDTPPAQGYAQPLPNQGHPSHMAPPYGSAPAYHQPLGVSPQPHPSAMGPNGPVDFSAWGLDNATAAFGMQLGQSAVAAGSDYVQKNVRPNISLSLPLARVLTPRAARRVHPHLQPQAPLQRLKLLCHQETPYPPLSLAAQTLVPPGRPPRERPVRMGSPTRGHQLSRSLHSAFVSRVPPVCITSANVVQLWPLSRISSLPPSTLALTPAFTPRFSESLLQKLSPWFSSTSSL